MGQDAESIKPDESECVLVLLRGQTRTVSQVAGARGAAADLAIVLWVAGASSIRAL
jgi:hypothetical protein